MSNKYTPIAIFDAVVDYIDECITQQMPASEISQSLLSNTGVPSAVLSGMLKSFNFEYSSVTNYVSARRAYLALDYMLQHPDKQFQYISDIFGYGDPSIFSREIKKHFNVTPSKAKEQQMNITDNRLTFCEPENENNSKDKSNSKIEVNKMKDEIYEEIIENRIEYLVKIQESLDIPLDPDTVYLISEIAEKFGVAPDELCNIVAEAIVDLHSEQEYSPKEEACINLRIDMDELNQISDFYGCKYYELSDYLVSYYHMVTG